MEEVFLRFPHLAEQIFEQIDNEHLYKCTKVDKHWNGFISGQKLPWIRMISKYIDFSEAWLIFCRKSKINTLSVIAKTMTDYDRGHFPKHGNPLEFAAMTGNIEIVAELLKTQSGDQPKDEHGKTPLHHAAFCGYSEICKMIVEKFKDANPKDKRDVTPLHEAAFTGSLDVCKFIVEYVKENNPNGFTLEFDVYNQTPFHVANELYHLKICQFLIDNAVEKNPVISVGQFPSTLYHLMASLPNNAGLEACRLIIERIEDILPRIEENTPLHTAVDNGNLEICKLIVDSLRDKNPIVNTENGETLLHDMVKSDTLLVPCQLIVERIRNKNPKDLEGKTPLHVAAQYGNYEAFKLIFQSVEDKNPKDNDQDTPFHLAAIGGHLSICQLILENVTDKNPQDNLQITPLHDAAERNRYDICKLIIGNIADIHPKNHEGKTPYDKAKEEGNTSIMKLLGYPFSKIQKSAITRPHLPPGFWGF